MAEENEVFIVSACRTAIGALSGAFKNTPAHDLGAVVMKEALIRAGIKGENVSEVIMGQSLTGGQGQNPVRVAALNAGIPASVPAYGVSMLCGSGLQSVNMGYRAIKSGEANVVLCGGQESMSMANHSALLRTETKLGEIKLKDNILNDALVDPMLNMHMGDTSEFLAQKYKIDRKAQDEFAYNSQMKTAKSLNAGYFVKEIVPVLIKNGKEIQNISKDESPRKNVTLEQLAKLQPKFSGTGKLSVTAGNASSINDGAAAVILMNKKNLQALKVKPIAKILSFAVWGLEPIEMGLGPIDATKIALMKAKWTINDVDLFEMNEAYAVQSLIVAEKLKIPAAKLNVAGGAISLGHPIGCSGTRILVTLLHNMERLQKKKGLASICVGGGMGVTITVELC